MSKIKLTLIGISFVCQSWIHVYANDFLKKLTMKGDFSQTRPIAYYPDGTFAFDAEKLNNGSIQFGLGYIDADEWKRSYKEIDLRNFHKKLTDEDKVLLVKSAMLLPGKVSDYSCQKTLLNPQFLLAIFPENEGHILTIDPNLYQYKREKNYSYVVGSTNVQYINELGSYSCKEQQAEGNICKTKKIHALAKYQTLGKPELVVTNYVKEENMLPKKTYGVSEFYSYYQGDGHVFAISYTIIPLNMSAIGSWIFWTVSAGIRSAVQMEAGKQIQRFCQTVAQQ